MKNKLRELIISKTKIDRGSAELVIGEMVNLGICIPKVGFGEEVYGVSYDKKKSFFKGVIVGITYERTKVEEPPEIWYTVAVENTKVEILNEDQVYATEEEVKEKLLKRK